MLRQRIVAIRGGGAWRKGKPLQAPSARNQVAGCASLCSRSIGVLQKLPHQRFPGKIRLLGVASLNLVSVAMGQTISALEATPKIWDLGAAWLVLDELHCPMRWLKRDPALLQPGEDLAQADFPVLAAKDATKAIPIVFVIGFDPVSSGLVQSLARPANNLTGVTLLSAMLESKRFGLLREMIKGASQFQRKGASVMPMVGLISTASPVTLS